MTPWRWSLSRRFIWRCDIGPGLEEGEHAVLSTSILDIRRPQNRHRSSCILASLCAEHIPMAEIFEQKQRYLSRSRDWNDSIATDLDKYKAERRTWPKRLKIFEQLKRQEMSSYTWTDGCSEDDIWAETDTTDLNRSPLLLKTSGKEDRHVIQDECFELLKSREVTWEIRAKAKSTHVFDTRVIWADRWR